MKSTLLVLLLVQLCYIQSFCQTKGASPLIKNTTSSVSSSTYAVVVGISDYQDPNIPDLKFADKDAEAFANFLRSPAGGSLDDDHLQVLTNNQATAGRIAEALDALIEKAKKEDQVIIYFSGHGDVEGKKLTQPGFLLCWDSPSRVYMGGGTYSLSFLQEVVSTLSVQNQAKVLVITDACHAGKLAGSQIGGAQLTTANLAKQYANEVKILSCQPNEYSLEGQQWGGGRGVFSYHLIDGLYGLADRNNDNQVTLGEIDRYLEDHVTGEAAPQSQVPILLGNKTDKIATINPNVLADLKNNKNNKMLVFAATESRGFEDEVLAKLDTTIKQTYKSFKQAIVEKHFLEPIGNCAEALYKKLSSIESLVPLLGIMKRNYAAALQDDAQQVMNKWLKTDLSEMLSQKSSSEKYRYYPLYLQRAAELLGETHYMYKALQSRKHFFNGYLIALSNQNPDKITGHKAIAQFKQALLLQDEFPLAYWQMSSVYAFNLLNLDSAEYYARKAIEMNPSCMLPYTNIAYILSENKLNDLAKEYLAQASRQDNNSATVWNSGGLIHNNAKEYADAEQKFQKAIQLEPNYAGAYNNLGITYCYTNRFLEAEDQFLKALKIDSTFDIAYINLGNVYIYTERLNDAVKIFRKVIQMDSTESSAYYNLGLVSKASQKYEEAQQLFKKTIQVDSTFTSAYNALANLYLNEKKYKEAEVLYKKVILIDSTETFAHYNLAILYNSTGKYDEAEFHYRKTIFLDSLFLNAYINLGDLYSKTKRLAEAEQSFLKAIKINSKDIDLTYALACVFALESKTDLAFYYLEQTILNGYNDYEWMQKDEDLAPLRELPKWKEIMNKYFPDKVK